MGIGNRIDSSGHEFLGAGTMNKQFLSATGTANKQPQQADTGPQLQPAEERRRSQRVMIQIPVVLEMTSGGTKTTIHAKTASVNDHGAMLLCTKNFPVKTKFELFNNRTSQNHTFPFTPTALKINNC